MNDLPFMRLWVKDLMADAAALGLTDEEFGVYVRLLCAAWLRGSIPTDNAGRARLIESSPSKLARIWPAIEGKWQSDGNGGLVNKRQEKEREAAAAKAEAGRKAAAARWGDAK